MFSFLERKTWERERKEKGRREGKWGEGTGQEEQTKISNEIKKLKRKQVACSILNKDFLMALMAFHRIS